MDARIHAALKHYFGFDGFLDHQEKIVESVLSGRDLCVIMPTGAGKSLCYQLPLLLRPGYGIVVSPLISLMKDQVDSLSARGIPAAFINSTVEFREQCRVIDQASRGELKLLYVAPERFQTEFFRSFLKRTPPETLIVDEAHCISQWGHDFRPAYRRIGEAAEEFGIAQICAFTATATPRVRDDIRKQLHRPGMELCVAGFKRPNLSFSVLSCASESARMNALRKLLEKPQPTIIYAATRKTVELLSGEFAGVIGYHAGMSDADRTLAQERFMNEPCPVLAATNAFGMGIDRADVRQVIHYNLPGSLEAYYQEAGRAGRDGEAANCVLLFSFRDRYVQEFLIDQGNPPPELVERLYRQLLELGARRGTNTLEVTLGELLPEIPGARSERQLSAAMAVLEKYGYVGRDYSHRSSGILHFTDELRKLAIQHQLENTQRSRFISCCIRRYGNALLAPQRYEISELAQVSGLSEAQLRRVLHALNGDVLEWSVPFTGCATELLHPEKRDLEIDFEELENKRAMEMERLEEACDYARARGCRQAQLIAYFGEDVTNWNCGCCDNCSGREAAAAGTKRKLSGAELEAVRSILQTVGDFRGRYGAGKISQVLVGARNAEVIGRNLHLNSHFGELRAWHANRIGVYFRALESAGYICRVEHGDFSCVELTARGLEVCDGYAVPELALPEEAHSSSRPRKKHCANSSPSPSSSPSLSGRRTVMSSRQNEVEEYGSLYEKLAQLRRELAAARGVQAYMIFGNETLTQLAERRPLTMAEANRIPGIGPVKAATVLPIFLEAIRNWIRNENASIR